MVGETAVQRDRLKWKAPASEHLLCLADTFLDYKGVWGDPEVGLELAGKVKRAEADGSGEIGRTYVDAKTGTVLRYDGKKFAAVPSKTTRDLHDVWVSANACEVWVSGAQGARLRYQ